MEIMVPEIDEIVNFYSPEVLEEIARETGFVQRESKLGGMEFLGIMTQGLYSQPDASLSQLVSMLYRFQIEMILIPSSDHPHPSLPPSMGKEFRSFSMSLISN